MGKGLQALAGGIGGAIVGFCVSFLVDQALYEISVNGFFAVVFGCSLLFMGGLILYRVNALSWEASADSRGTPKKSLSTYVVMMFACLVITAGLFCFFLEKNWFKFISKGVKIPMYTLLGIALWFALTFSIMDLFNFIGQYAVAKLSMGRRVWQPIVSTPKQIVVVLTVAVLLGMFFGVVFGTKGVEYDSVLLHDDLSLTMPVGALVCGVVGAINQAFLRPTIYSGYPNNMDAEYAPRGKAAYDDGI